MESERSGDLLLVRCWGILIIAVIVVVVRCIRREEKGRWRDERMRRSGGEVGDR